MDREARVRVPQPGGERSFWLQEALAWEAGEPCPPLQAKLVADVCIVGGGFAGLWTANELIRRDPSLRIALLEADICGGGASGSAVSPVPFCRPRQRRTPERAESATCTGWPMCTG